MEEIKEMLKAVINGQHALRSELFGEVSKMKKETRGAINALRQEMKDGFEKIDERFDGIDERLDKQGRQLAYLEEDAPTREEFADLESRVDKLEKN